MVERQPEERVARLEQRHVGGVVGLGAGVGLDVGVLGAEQLLGAVDRQLLGDVDLLAAAVIAAAREPSAYLLVSTEPTASSTAWGTKFSEAIISRVPCWRRSSPSSTAAISGSTSASGAVWKFSGSSLKVRPTIPTDRDTLRPVKARYRLAIAAVLLLVAVPIAP